MSGKGEKGTGRRMVVLQGSLRAEVWAESLPVSGASVVQCDTERAGPIVLLGCRTQPSDRSVSMG